MSERFLMKGNEAVAEAAIRAGCRCYFGYPITPQTEIAAYMSKHMKVRRSISASRVRNSNELIWYWERQQSERVP